jgi:hypothetical protein
MFKRFNMFDSLLYLKIENSYLRTFSFYVPIILTFVFIVAYLSFPIKLNIFGDKGLVDSVNSFLSILTGFFVASLAAVATFQNENLDKQIQGKKATLEYVRGRKSIVEELTRRRFLCLLFGYCSLISFLLSVFGIFSRLFKDNVKLVIGTNFHSVTVVIFLAIYIFFFFNLMITTFLGLNYLTDRIHRP